MPPPSTLKSIFTPNRLGQDSVTRQAQSLQMLLRLPTHESLGVALAMLLQASYDAPDMLRVVLNEQVVHEGFRGESMITVLARAARS